MLKNCTEEERAASSIPKTFTFQYTEQRPIVRSWVSVSDVEKGTSRDIICNRVLVQPAPRNASAAVFLANFYVF